MGGMSIFLSKNDGAFIVYKMLSVLGGINLVCYIDKNHENEIG